MKQKLLVMVFSLLSVHLSAQQITVSGKVSDMDDGAPLPGVNVIIKGSSSGTVTDVSGNYTITADADDELIFSFIGYVTEEISVGQRSKIDVSLTADITQLNEVVVVGYGTQAKREITGSIAQIDGAKLQQIQVPSFEAALQGQAAGVQVIQGSGLSGAGSVVRVRGISSVSANGDPLYVVDGIPITANNFLAEANWQNGAFNNNPLAALNPNDIKSIEILKDAAAAGIYGSRGANGVILITTKRGKSGKPTFNFTATTGFSEPVAKPNLLNSQEWLQIRQEAWELDGNTGAVWLPGYSEASDSPEERLAAYQEASQNNTDWWDLLTDTGVKQSYNLSSRFSLMDRLKAYVGLSYSDNESYIKGNSFKRLSARANIDYAVNDQLDVVLSTSLSRGINERVRVSYTGGLGDAMSTALPIYPVFDDQGDFWRGNTRVVANPVFTNANFQGFTIDDRVINTLSLKYRPINKLEFTVSGGVDYLDQKNDQWESGELRGDFIDTDGDDVADSFRNRSERDVRWVTNYNLNALAAYDYGLSDASKFKLMLGAEYQESVTSGKNNIVHLGTDVGSTLWKEEGNFSNETEQTQNLFRLSDDKWSFLSFLARVNYALNDKYFFQATARADGSSRFGEDNRFGFFPVISGAWLLSEESFMDNVGSVNFLKLKAAFGITGNANFPSNQWVGTYATNPNPVYNGQPIRFPNKVNNPDLKWETTKSFDVGFEVGLFNERLDMEVSYYLKRTEDVLMNLTLPQYNGFGSFWDNVGEIENKGVDLTFTTKNLVLSDFTWTTTFNIGYNTNEVLSIGNYTEDAVSGGTNDTRIVEGFPVGTNFLIRYSRVDPLTGRPIYLDVNGFETFEYNEQRDRVPVGDVLPDAVGSFSNLFTYKNFDLNVLFVFTIGGNIYDSSSKRQLQFLSDWNTREDIGNRWKQPGDVATYPKVTLTPSEHGNDKEWFNTDLFLHDASYLRMRNIALGYNLPSSFTDRIGIQGAKVTVSGTNLLTFTKFPGLDPEVVRDFDNVTDRNLSPNVTYLTPPQEKAYSITLNVSF